MALIMEELKTEIALLGSLAGSNNLEEDLRGLLTRYPEVSRVIPILIAIARVKFPVLKYIYVAETYTDYDFSKSGPSISDIESIVSFCTWSGITGLLASLQYLRDYMAGVVDLMRLHKHDPEAIQFLADMMET